MYVALRDAGRQCLDLLRIWKAKVSPVSSVPRPRLSQTYENKPRLWSLEDPLTDFLENVSDGEGSLGNPYLFRESEAIPG